MVDSNPAGLEAWRSGGLEAGGLDPGALEACWIACWLAGWQAWIGLDWIGVAARLEVLVVGGRVQHAQRLERSADI